MITTKTTQEEQRNIIAKMVNNDQNASEFTTIRISREVYNDLSKRGWYKATHSDIISKLLEDTGSNLDPSPINGGSF
jgi:hypothetical protein